MSFRRAMIIALCLCASTASVKAADQQSLQVKASDKAACMPDALRLCREAVPNGVHDVLVCFSKNRAKISGRCNAVLASYGL